MIGSGTNTTRDLCCCKREVGMKNQEQNSPCGLTRCHNGGLLEISERCELVLTAADNEYACAFSYTFVDKLTMCPHTTYVCRKLGNNAKEMNVSPHKTVPPIDIVRHQVSMPTINYYMSAEALGDLPQFEVQYQFRDIENINHEENHFRAFPCR